MNFMAHLAISHILFFVGNLCCVSYRNILGNLLIIHPRTEQLLIILRQTFGQLASTQWWMGSIEQILFFNQIMPKHVGYICTAT